MLNTRNWRGALGAALGNHLYINMSSDAAFESACAEIFSQVQRLVPESSSLVRMEAGGGEQEVL